MFCWGGVLVLLEEEEVFLMVRALSGRCLGEGLFVRFDPRRKWAKVAGRYAVGWSAQHYECITSIYRQRISLN